MGGWFKITISEKSISKERLVARLYKLKGHVFIIDGVASVLEIIIHINRF
jgi:hypothetical protein